MSFKLVPGRNVGFNEWPFALVIDEDRKFPTLVGVRGWIDAQLIKDLWRKTH